MADKGTGNGATKKAPGEALHQRRNLPFCPLRLAIGGVAVAGIIGYSVLYSKKKPEASAVDVAKVTSGVATPDNTHPR
uniref:Uncharacterized protein n=1 Tax=Chenopodium quinoa TaxID=63459 RepID=A0A803MI75_CHEQI